MCPVYTWRGLLCCRIKINKFLKKKEGRAHEAVVALPKRTMVMYMMKKTTEREVGISYSGSVSLKTTVTCTVREIYPETI